MGKRGWAAAVEGPAPFSAAEQAIIEARRLFRWNFVGLAGDGDVQVSVTNDSVMRLPFYSLGVRANGGGFSGRLWLPIGDLPPGSSRILERECYKRNLPRNAIELYTLPDPSPEERDDYWEFRGTLP